jgi:hypothetical protein
MFISGATAAGTSQMIGIQNISGANRVNLYDGKLVITSGGAATFSSSVTAGSSSTSNYGTINDVGIFNNSPSGGSSSNPAYYGAIRLTGGGYDWGAIRTIQTNPSASWTSRMAFFTMSGAGGSLVERMAITNDGNLLIGTTTGITGGGALQVNGNVNINGVFQINGVTIGGGGGSGITGAGTTNYLPKYSSSTSIGNSVMYDNGTSIGLGTANPTGQASNNRVLQIYGAGTANRAQLHLVNSNTGEGTSDGTFIGIDDSTNLYINNSESAATIFENAGSERMRITSGGNVLIGTTTDSGNKLDVNGIGRFVNGDQSAARVIIQNTGSGGQAVHLVAGNPNVDQTGFSIAYGNTNILRFSSIGLATFSGAYGTNNGVNINGTTYATLNSNRGTSVASAGVNYSSVNVQRWFTGIYENSDNFGFYNVGLAGFPLILNYSTGAATFSSSVTATSFFESSDKRLKKEISDNPIISGIEAVKPKLYIKDGKEELGYYAQDLQEILPSAVIEGEDGFLSLSYAQVLVAKVASLEKRIMELEAKLN